MDTSTLKLVLDGCSVIFALTAVLVLLLIYPKRFFKRGGWIIALGCGLLAIGSLFSYLGQFSDLPEMLGINNFFFSFFIKEALGFFLGYIFLYTGILFLARQVEYYENQHEADIHEIKESKIKLEHKVTERTEDLNKALKEAHAGLKVKSEFLSNISHELRTPLNAILGFAQVLKNQPKHSLSPEQDEYVNYIYDSGKHLYHQINQILDYTEADNGELKLNYEEVDLKEVFEFISQKNEPLADKHSVRIKHKVKTSDGIRIFTDRQTLHQVLTHVLNNAIIYNKQNGFVSIEANITKDNFARIEITDTGKGIPVDKQKKLFTPFDQPSMKAHKGGIGIGLALSRKLVEAMNGFMGFESIPGSGSTFWIMLPANEHSEQQINQ